MAAQCHPLNQAQTNKHKNKVMLQEAAHLPYQHISHYSSLQWGWWLLPGNSRAMPKQKIKPIICTKNTSFVCQPVRSWLDIQLCSETEISRWHNTERERCDCGDVCAHIFPRTNRGVLSLNLFKILSLTDFGNEAHKSLTRWELGPKLILEY